MSYTINEIWDAISKLNPKSQFFDREELHVIPMILAGIIAEHAVRIHFNILHLEEVEEQNSAYSLLLQAYRDLMCKGYFNYADYLHS